jgi:hypothetical protein
MVTNWTSFHDFVPSLYIHSFITADDESAALKWKSIKFLRKMEDYFQTLITTEMS